MKRIAVVLIVMLLAVPVFSQGAVDRQAELNKTLLLR